MSPASFNFAIHVVPMHMCVVALTSTCYECTYGSEACNADPFVTTATGVDIAEPYNDNKCDFCYKKTIKPAGKPVPPYSCLLLAGYTDLTILWAFSKQYCFTRHNPCYTRLIKIICIFKQFQVVNNMCKTCIHFYKQLYVFIMYTCRTQPLILK